MRKIKNFLIITGIMIILAGMMGCSVMMAPAFSGCTASKEEQEKSTKPVLSAEKNRNIVTNENSITFSWTGEVQEGAIVSYECRKDGGSWEDNGLSTSYKWSGYSEGSHTFEVRAKGNEGAYSSTISWSFTYKEGTIEVGEMVQVEGGTFQMGDTWGDGYSDEKPVHEVTLTYNFYIGKYEVTFEEYDEYCDDIGKNKPNNEGWEKGRHPVRYVSWWDTIEYCNWLSVKKGLAKAYDENGNLLDKNGSKTTDITKVEGYRLPTEAEWEYAARGGNKSNGYKYAGSNDPDEVAWYENNSGDRTHEVGTKKPNELGIYDMSGNVFEWCNDWYDSDYYEESPNTNPYNNKTDTNRVIRGGSLNFSASSVRVAYREYLIPSGAYNVVGFRVCRTAF